MWLYAFFIVLTWLYMLIVIYIEASNLWEVRSFIEIFFFRCWVFIILYNNNNNKNNFFLLNTFQVLFAKISNLSMKTLLITLSLLSRMHHHYYRECARRDDRGFYRVSCVSLWGVVCWEGFLDLIIKLWLMFRSRYLVLWSLGTYGLRESR